MKLALVVLWYSIGMWACIFATLRENNGKFYVKDIPVCLGMSLFGPIVWIIIFFWLLERNGEKVLFEAKKKD